MSQPLIALVGRPNVGKSTLFNRIIGQRDAIVDDMPGVTRDRHYGDAEWAGKRFTVIDTGGFVPLSDDVFESAIREQVLIAIEEANLIVFVVDGRTGPLPMDHEIATILRESRKSVVLVVNKVDADSFEPAVGEFYAMGIGEPIPVSALMGRHVGDLLDRLTEDYPRDTRDDDTTRLRIAIIGRPNVGKSSLVNSLLQQDRHIVTDIPGTTRDPIDTVLKYYGQEFILVDTAGLRRKSKVRENVEFYSTIRTIKSIGRCDIAVVVIDATQGLEHQDLWIMAEVVHNRKPAVLAVNKWDLVEKDDTTAREYERALRSKLRQLDFVPIIFISALTRQRIYKLIELVKAVDAESNRKIGTSELNSTIGNDIKTFPPKGKGGKLVKIKYVTQMETRPPVFGFFCNEPDLVDQNYKRYLENRLREHYRFSGVPLVLTFKKK